MNFIIRSSVRVSRDGHESLPLSHKSVCESQMVSRLCAHVGSSTSEFVVSLESLVRESERLVEMLDPLVEDIADIRLQGVADSAWYRLGVVNVLVRDAGGGALAATLARGLVEQAAYWDWALATGVGVEHLDQWAALELDGLRELARDADDDVWLGWLLPPGTSVTGSAGPAMPKNASDAVRRIGSGLDGAVLSPLGFAGLLSAYAVLGVLAHSNYLGAAILAEQLDLELPDRLAAVATHLAAAGATVVTFALADDTSCLDAATTQFEVVAHKASEIHGLPAQTSRPRLRLPHSRQARPVVAESSISRMPSAPPEMTELGLRFLEAASNLASVVASEEIEVEEGCEWIAYQSFRLSLSNLWITSGALTGTLGKALLPISARMLFEDGARWNWLPHSATTATTGESLKALVTDGVQRRDRIATRLRSDGVPRSIVEELLGPAVNIPQPDPGELDMPPLDEMLVLAYPNPSGVDSAQAIYSVLSQFVHATPISTLHFQRDTFPSVSAPVYAVALEATARGFERIASITLLLRGFEPESIQQPLEEIRRRGAEIANMATLYHCLG